jgi:hypothetical protein
MTNCSVSSVIVTGDRYADFVPFVSTVTNVIDLIAKVVLAIIERCYPSFYAEIASNPWVDYVVNQKDVATCLLLAVPVYNIYMAITLAQARQQAREAEYDRRMLVRMREVNYIRQLSLRNPDEERAYMAQLDVRITACANTPEGRTERGDLEWARAAVLRAERSYDHWVI